MGHESRPEHYKPKDDPQYDGIISDWDAFMETIENPEPVDYSGMVNEIFYSDLKNSFNSSLRGYPILWNILVFINADENIPGPGEDPPSSFYIDTVKEDLARVFEGDDNDETFINSQCDNFNYDPNVLIDKFM